MTAPAQAEQPVAEPTGDTVCEACGCANVVWFTNSELWNACHDGADVLCPMCFIKRAEAHGHDKSAWLIAPEAAPSGRAG